MQSPTLLKKIQGLELWTSQDETGEAFAVKHHPCKMRLAKTLAEAEVLFERMLGEARAARAH